MDRTEHVNDQRQRRPDNFTFNFHLHFHLPFYSYFEFDRKLCVMECQTDKTPVTGCRGSGALFYYASQSIARDNPVKHLDIWWVS